MADFAKSMIVLDSWEGGYANNPKDTGGETYCGISRKNWPNWEGWVFIDDYKKHSEKNEVRYNYKFIELNIPVSIFYQTNFWNKQSFNLLNNQDVADKIFQHYVNMGNRAIKFIQAIVFYGFNVYDNTFEGKNVDGSLGQLTTNRINIYLNVANRDKLLLKYSNMLQSYYEKLIAEHPQLKVFEHEWMLRAKTMGKRP